MKKTLLTTFALACSAAFGADLVGTITVGEGNTFSLIAPDGTAVSGFSAERTGSLSVISVADNSYSLNAGTRQAPMFKFAGIDGLTMENFSVTFTATWSTIDGHNWPNLISFGEEPGSWDYKFFPSRGNGFTWGSAKIGYSDITLTKHEVASGMGDGKAHDYIFSMETTGGNSRVINLYEDGTLVCSGTVDQHFGAPSTFWLAVGGSLDGDQNPAGTFSNIKVYNGVITPVVPEPATAALSLLALAGLAARRRRK